MSAPGTPSPPGFIEGDNDAALGTNDDALEEIREGDTGGGPPPVVVAPPPTLLVEQNVQTISFAVSFGYNTRPPDERVNTKLLKLWADGVLIYTTDLGFGGTEAGIAGLQITFHPGLADAMPDDFIQTIEGDDTPGFRDLMYVVIQHYPLPQKQSKLPTIRAEISDYATVATPTVTPYTMLPTPGYSSEHCGFYDANTQTLWGFDSSDSPFTVLRSYSVPNKQELGGFLLPQFSAGQINLTYGWSLFDSDNRLVWFPVGTSNSPPLVAVRIDDGAVITEFGVDSASLITDATHQASSFWPSVMKYRAWGVTCYGIMTSGIYDGFCMFGYTHTPRNLITVNGVPMMLDRGERVQGNDLDLQFDAKLPFASMGCAVSYPLLDLPNMMTQNNISSSDSQDYIGLAGYGSLIDCIVAGLKISDDGSTVSFVVRDGASRNILDVSPGIPNEMFINPSDGDLIVICYYTGSYTISKYRIIWEKDTSGESLGVIPSRTNAPTPIYTNMPLPGYNPGANHQSLRASDLSFGYMGYVDATNFNVVNLHDGTIVYSQGIGYVGTDSFTFNGGAMGVDFVSLVAGKPTHIDLHAPTTTGGDPLPDVLRWCALKLGYTADQISSVGLDSETVLGGFMQSATPVRPLLQSLSLVFDFSIVEVGGTIKFVRSLRNSAASIATIGREDISPISEGGDMNPIKTTVSAPDEVSADVSINYIDPTMDYVNNVQTFRRVRFPFETVKTNRATTYTLPIVMQPSEALSRAGRLVFAGFATSIVYEWRVPHRFVKIEPSDVVKVLNFDGDIDLIQVTQMTYNQDWSISLAGVNWTYNDNVVLTADTPLGKRPNIFHGPSDSIPFAFDIPLLNPVDEVPGFLVVYSGAGSLGQSWWEQANVSQQVGTAPAVSLYDETVPLIYGLTGSALPQSNSLGTTFQTDSTTVLRVSGPAFEVSGLFLPAVNTLFKAALVGRPGRWELIYFTTVTRINDHTADISGILRGRRGTDVNCDLHKGADLFVPVTKFLHQDHLSVDALTSIISYRAAGVNTSRIAEPAVLSPFTGASAKPWAPTYLKAKNATELNLVAAPDYSNPGGGAYSGGYPDRRSLITVTSNHLAAGGFYDPSLLVDGDNTFLVNYIGLAAGQTNLAITFDFRAMVLPQRITEFKWSQNTGSSNGHYNFDGSVDGVTWTTLLSNFELGGASGSLSTGTFTNPTGYNFYRLIQVSGTTVSCRVLEVTFKIMSDVATNDVVISWLRRDRLGKQFVTNPQTLAEASEKYDIELLDGSGHVLRTVDGLTHPLYNYTAANQATDGFSPPLSSVQVRVYQVSQLVGRGFPKGETLYVS